MSVKRYSHLTVEAALCLWEAATEARFQDNNVGLPESMAKAWDDYGTATIRYACIIAAGGIGKLWNGLTENQREALVPYDWEFVPTVLRLSRFEGEALILPDIKAVKQAAKDEMAREKASSAPVAEADPFDAWLAEVKRLGLERYTYDQSEGYEIDAMRKYFTDGDTPEEWSDWHADKYDLDRTDRGWA